ncbi:5051_t:CDS:2 [Racocetra fulgida]|uniref:5051_t:CDS:1 n=1 Tax=Racocetra fulgida TaxID=60492 RepID=A0A9N9EH02_9GLOM|nr:5051_t:CDS:2 [Racocetra fulgida]
MLRHKFSCYIEILEEKANKWRNYTICCACCDAIDKAAAILHKFLNKSDRVKNYLKKCKNFIDEQGSKEAVLKLLSIDLEKENEELDTIVGTKKSCLEQSGGRILNKKIEKINNITKIKLKNNSVGPTLAFDSWTNVINQNIIEAVFIIPEGEILVWKEIDVSGERERLKEVIEKIEWMFTEIIPNKGQVPNKKPNKNKELENLENEMNVDEYEKLLDQEKKAQIDASADLDYDLEANIDNYLLTHIHPAMDIKAK